ncbi:hypothetical protein BABINDRAFT_159521 [Babjeviella inositovora NRRL Y-12698]|uniref:Uncharacterized protein n=1 Tax=Babjeviella inositovora NRRL Y-12698 TaxID=984486 RepID=A0A1E3QZI6_9ASCO|nr:uncharacterized protein BABINDRAFT_159521 [Babjeviella inositovora NRRL Y-12698]ODQ83056.1 hypothetical protein BABINDRAFT_159521 [Babjeviella inositovora NRRL Y-12698]
MELRGGFEGPTTRRSAQYLLNTYSTYNYPHELSEWASNSTEPVPVPRGTHVPRSIRPAIGVTTPAITIKY